MSLCRSACEMGELLAAEMGDSAAGPACGAFAILALLLPLSLSLQHSAWEGPLRGFCGHLSVAHIAHTYQSAKKVKEKRL